MDRHVWGRAHWEMLLLIVDTADRCPEPRAAACRVLTLLTQTMPCEPCRCFYTHNVVVWIATGDTTPLTSWLFDMRSVIDAKVKGSLGWTEPQEAWTHCAAAAVVPCSSRYQLMKRAAVSGITISSDQVCVQVMLEALRLRDVAKAEDQPRVTTAAFRAYCLTAALEGLSLVLRPVRPAFSAALAKGVADAKAAALDAGEGWTWTLPFTAAFVTSAALEDGIAGAPGATLGSVLAQLEPARHSLLSWAHDHAFPKE